MTRDVVIVGGGIAGLSAAWRLRHRDILLLEGSDRLGGRMRSDPCGDYWLNYGAHLFPSPGSLVDRMATECKLETVPVFGGMMGLAVDRTIIEGGRVESYPFRLPLSVRERIAFARAGLKVQLAVRRYNAAPNKYEFMNDRTFAEFLGPLPPKVRMIFAGAARRATGELDELAAGAGVGLFAIVWAGKGSLISRNLRGGTGELPAAIGRELGDRARVDSRVDAVRPDGGELVLSVGGEEIRARHVIMAANAPYAAPLVAPVAERTADALSKLTYGAFLSVAVETNETTPMPYDGVYAIATPGRAFDMFTNQAHALRVGPRKPGGSLMLFTGAQAAATLMRESDEVIVERFLADLHAMYPRTRGVIANATVRRWELGNVYASPGRGRLQPALEGALGAEQNLHLAGDYFAALGTMEAAAQTGLAAAERVDSLIREVTHV
ncbi:protoporphyrinogen/coproporphyrinogen oxidase [Solirubrobacter soli]|uniref:protoporphyrinogen/coproporphyrinogen oxidase n=1 Tax=Solirubrobacter soli TaxID=363832 RepID=UPI000402C6E9|nr:NAD(P)/FAD-dependent oxidoreductase [Solirubrobacter soli]